jgi:hypothetical protein
MESDLNAAAARGTQGEGRPSLDNEPEAVDAGPLGYGIGQAAHSLKVPTR